MPANACGQVVRNCQLQQKGRRECLRGTHCGRTHNQ